MRRLRCARCSHLVWSLSRVRTPDGRIQALCASCLEQRKAMGVRVEIIRA